MTEQCLYALVFLLVVLSVGLWAVLLVVEWVVLCTARKDVVVSISGGEGGGR